MPALSRLRAYHALLAVLVVSAYFSTEWGPAHAWLGYGVAVVIALRLVMALTGDKTLFRLRAQAAMGSIEQARSADGNEGLTIQDHVPDWLRVRGYAGDYTTPAEGFYGGWITPSFLLV